ncbi:O-phospho-L-serine:2-oxoglutarate transaminase [Aspergillus stella-maris]|uniref:O-phospho-L-serine:2-oxoglutarate transaminase n=1 Tax=Aspergillus stella-maris TaxID=1810926 RepID=UPI003CCCB238
MKREDITYLGAGPAALPSDVLATAAEALQNYENTGLGVAEHSHRSELATNILNTMKSDLASFLDIPDDFEILIMQGGGSGQFDATVYNLTAIWVERQRQKILKEKGDLSEEEVIAELRKKVDAEFKVDYLVTGSWSLKASQEAVRLLGPEYVNVASDARTANDGKFGKIADESTWKLSPKAAMTYLCENETVDGVEYPAFPKVLESKGSENDPIVIGDFSSTILSRRIPFENFSIVYFGAQKNLGMTGITGVIIRKSLLPPNAAPASPTILRKLGLPIAPTILDYSVAHKNNSLYNTLSIFDVYVAGQVLKKLLAAFPDKVDGQQAVAERKAKKVYEALEAYPDVYRIVPDKAVRSRMNICFRVIKNGAVDESEKTFLKGGTERGITGMKGHRSVGGIRVSNYNAIPESGIDKLSISKMSVIAIAGGSGGVGQTLVDVLTQEAKHEVIVLTRKAQQNNPIISRAKQLEVDYADVAALTKQLNEHKVETVISALSLYEDAHSQAQLNLIRAAEGAECTKRFIPSEYSFIQTEDLLHLDPTIQYFLDAANLLKGSKTLKFTRVIPGFFMDYWGLPHVKSNLEQHTMLVDMQNCEAVIPGSGDDVIGMTYSCDMARFIAQLLEVDASEWEEFSVIVGDEISANQLVGLGEKVRGKKFSVKYDSVDDVMKGDVTLPLKQPEGLGYSEEEMKETIALVDRLVVGKCFDFPKNIRANGRFPNLKLKTIEEVVREAWEGRS